MGLVSSALNAGANIASTATTNAANRAIADKQNEEAKRQFNENLDWMKYQYEDSKDYNNAANERARLVEAGYNPLWMDGAGQPAQSVGGVSPTASMVLPTMQAPQFDIAKDMLNIASAREKDSLTEGNDMQNAMTAEMMSKGHNSVEQAYRAAEEQIKKVAAERGELLTRAQLNRQSTRLYKAQQAKCLAETDKTAEEMRGIRWQNDFNIRNEKTLDAKVAQELTNLRKQQKQIESQTAANYANAALSQEEINTQREQQNVLKQQGVNIEKMTEAQAFRNTWIKYGVTENSEMLTRISAMVYDGKLTWLQANAYMEEVAKNLSNTHRLAKKWDVLNESHLIWNAGKDQIDRFNAHTNYWNMYYQHTDRQKANEINEQNANTNTADVIMRNVVNMESLGAKVLQGM